MEIGSNMLSVQGTLLFVVIILIVYVIYMNGRKSRQLPPGPMALPLIGNFVHIGPDPRIGFKKLGKLYGDIFSVYLGPKLVVVLNSYDVIKEAFLQNGAYFNDRPDFFFQTVWKNKGIATVSGELWREQKRFLLQAFNKIGMKERVFQQSIEKEAEELVTGMIDRSKEGSVSQNPIDLIIAAICNVTCTFLWNTRCDYDNPVSKSKLVRMKENFELIGGTELLNIYPALKYVPGDYFRYKKFIQNIECDISINDDCIQEHRKSRQPGKPRDFVDTFLDMADSKADEQNSTFTDEQLHRVLLDIFGAGTQSPAASLAWTLLYMLHYPQVLQKIREEITEAVGKRKILILDDRPKIPYTEATILEVMRLSDVTPLGIPHATSQDIIFRGFHIPKRTMVISNLNAVCRDPSLWYNPDSFIPERFLEVKDGVETVLKADKFIPFSIGKRSCPGESFARMELLIFFANIVHNVDFSLPIGCELPSINGKLSTVYMPPDFKIIANSIWTKE